MILIDKSWGFCLAIIAAAGILNGCAVGPTKDSSASLAKTVSQIESSLDSSSKDATRLRRLNFAYSLQSQNVTAAQFVEFSCQGVGAYAEQRAALSGLHQLGATVDTLTATPGDDLGTVIGSIQKYRSKLQSLPVGKSENIELEAIKSCMKQTEEDLKAVNSNNELQGRSLLAIPAAISSLEVFGAAVQKLILLTAQQIDRAQRAARFKEFMRMPDTQQALRNSLGPCTIPNGTGGLEFSIDKIGAGDMETFTKQCFEKAGAANSLYALSDARLQTVISERRKLSLIIPYNQFLLLNPITRGSNGSRSEYLVKVGAVDSSLATFDSLRAQSIVKGQHLAIVTSINDLYRVSQGNLTSKEELQLLWATAQNLAGLLQSANDDLSGVKTTGKALADAIQQVTAP